MKRYLLFILFCSKVFCKMDSSELAITSESLPRLPDTYSTPSSQVVINRGKGIILIGNIDALVSDQELEKFEGYHVIDLNIPGKKQVLQKRLESLYLDQEVTWDTLNQMKDTIIKYYQDHNRPIVALEIPEQNVSNGVIQFLVLEGIVGEVKIEGNRYFSSKSLRKKIQIQSGSTIDQQKLLRDIYFLNGNPFRQANVIYAPGIEQGTTDIIIHIDDRRPYRFYGGLENTGVDTTGRNHWFTGFNWGNVSGLGDILSYQFTSSYNPHSFYAHTMQYLCPLPWYHIVNIYGGYSSVHAHLPPPAKHNSGFSGQASLRYSIPLPIGISLNHNCILGFDWKRTNNNVEFTDETPTFGNNINLAQWIVGYRGNYEKDWYRLDFEGEFYWSPGRWIGDQTNADYESIRPDAKNHWIYFRGILNALIKLPHNFSLFLKGVGQWSNQNLIPSEQYGLGGYDTVRGYEQRELNFDTALNSTIEVRSPALRVATRNYTLRKKRDALQFLLFFDYGWGSNKNAVPGNSKTGFLAGIGPGLRYTFDPYVTARLDIGRKLHTSPRFGGGDIMCHFAVTCSY